MRLPRLLLDRWAKTGYARTSTGFVPRPSALHATGRDGGEGAVPGGPARRGTTLPDGLTVTVDWRNGPSSGVTLSASADWAAHV
jgi:hypothetical protein